jgi:hypothetical protein
MEDKQQIWACSNEACTQQMLGRCARVMFADSCQCRRLRCVGCGVEIKVHEAQQLIDPRAETKDMILAPLCARCFKSMVECMEVIDDLA